jgi:adenine deaminase
LRNASLTPLESLQAATRNAAIALGRSDLGTIENGKFADAVVFTSGPLDPSDTTFDIREVIKGGIVYESDVLLNEFRLNYRDSVRDVWENRVLWFIALCIALVIVFGIATWGLRGRLQWRRA